MILCLKNPAIFNPEIFKKIPVFAKNPGFCKKSRDLQKIPRFAKKIPRFAKNPEICKKSRDFQKTSRASLKKRINYLAN